MAATSAGRVLALCKQFHNVVRISSTIPSQNTGICLTKSSLARQNLLAGAACPIWPVVQCRPLHTTISRMGLEEFFDLPENWGESTVKSGAPWTVTLLRSKSNEELHKLWYLLLKEKNMLLTIEQEAKRQRVSMPSPERLKKIERSMQRLDKVVEERETALRLLQTGQEYARPADWRRNLFGKVVWHRFREYAIPWYMNATYKRRRFYTPSFVKPHIRLRMEKNLRTRARQADLEKKQLAKLKEKFPQMKASS
ncbi:39S ribosomal protein L47, mitochondrial [Gadus macrocephalus]|uniref:39S ribosomal protein L47, mitochondrial n=1 Tax=Gadus macrocephalus TaxID=80720 RepID=UPI0028CB3E57|nr:39S ribosomal protein L47, mitochondrial [Gadus macrocephalus]